MKEFWNDRYEESPYAYGKAPNAFLAHVLQSFDIKGRMLFPAEGEGRNAVFAASLGLNVFAFDYSQSGRSKAMVLAQEKGVSIHYDVVDFESADFSTEYFDAAALIFAHFPAKVKTSYYRKTAEWLKPGGYMISEVFSKNHMKFQQINPRAGGPKDIDMLFDSKELEKIFPDFNIKYLEEVETVLDEGIYHQGMSSVIRFVGIKK